MLPIRMALTLLLLIFAPALASARTLYCESSRYNSVNGTTQLEGDFLVIDDVVVKDEWFFDYSMDRDVRAELIDTIYESSGLMFTVRVAILDKYSGRIKTRQEKTLRNVGDGVLVTDWADYNKKLYTLWCGLQK